MIGLLGALDPYKRKLNQTKGSGSSGQGLPVSEAIHKGADSQDSNSQGNVCSVCVCVYVRTYMVYSIYLYMLIVHYSLNHCSWSPTE